MSPDSETIAAIKKVLEDRGWLGPLPLPESIEIMVDLLESYQQGQSDLRLKLYNLQRSIEDRPK